jgi:hypothetical protein
MRFLASALALAGAMAYSASASTHPYAADAVVSTGTPPLRAYLNETRDPGGTIHVDMWETAAGNVVRSYDVDMTKLLHMIVVSDGLTDFRHIHPVLHSNGHFTIAFHPAQRGLYHIYIDGIAHGFGRQVFRFDIPVGTNAPAEQRHVNAAGNSSRVGPYEVTLDPVLVPFGEIATIEVSITKDGKPATDLHPYLGAMAHGVFVGIKDLAYMHAHGMSDQMLAAASSDCGDSIMLSMPPLPATYKVPSTFAFDILAPSEQSYDFWLEFVGGNTLYTAPFLVTSR